MSTVSRLPRGATLTIGGNRIEATKFTMGTLTDELTRFVDRPVVDQTGLASDAAYDLTLELTQEDFLRDAAAVGNRGWLRTATAGDEASGSLG
jgi:uncharacterized protein (TIGR03435 family)